MDKHEIKRKSTERAEKMKAAADAARAEKENKNPEAALKTEIKKAAGLDIITYEITRNRIAEKWNIRKSVVDKWVRSLKQEADVEYLHGARPPKMESPVPAVAPPSLADPPAVK